MAATVLAINAVTPAMIRLKPKMFQSENLEILEQRLVNHLRRYPHGSDQLLETALYTVEARGRRLRPLLCLIVFEQLAQTQIPDEVYAVACSVEYLHSASLILDDLPEMDDAILRRGRKCCHLQFSPARATLAAFFLCDVAQHLVDKVTSESGMSGTTDLQDRFRLVKGLMMRGQILDLENKELSFRALVKKCALKSGALYGLAASMPAYMLGLASEAKQLDKLGRYLGIVHQISDDLLDCNDVNRGTENNTLVHLLGVEAALELRRRFKEKAKASFTDATHSAAISELIDQVSQLDHV